LAVFIKLFVFGSTNPDMQQKLAKMAVEIVLEQRQFSQEHIFFLE
jgi:hypothetical protein